METRRLGSGGLDVGILESITWSIGSVLTAGEQGLTGPSISVKSSDSVLTGRGMKLVVRDRGRALGVASESTSLVELSWSAEAVRFVDMPLNCSDVDSRSSEREPSHSQSVVVLSLAWSSVTASEGTLTV